MQRPNRLREIMDLNGYTVAKLAKSLGVSEIAVKSWISGKRTPPVAAVTQDDIARELGVESGSIWEKK